MQQPSTIPSRSGITITRTDGPLRATTTTFRSERTQSTPPLYLSETNIRVPVETTTIISQPRVVTSTTTVPISRTETRFTPPPNLDVAAAALATLTPSDDLAHMSREQLLERLRMERRELMELRRSLNAAREPVDSRTRQLLAQIDELTKELVGLQEENRKLKNLTNDELVMLEKVETKEVYGKKTKVQEELDQAKIIRTEYANIKILLQGRETRIAELERENASLRVQVANPPRVITTSMTTSNLFEKRNQELATENADLRNQLTVRLRDFDTRLNELRNENLSLKSQAMRPNLDLSRLRELEARINDLQNENRMLRSAPSSSTTTIRTVPDSRRESELLSNISQLRDRVAQLERELRDRAESGGKMGDTMAELARSRLREKELEAKIHTLEDNLKDTIFRFNSATAEVATLKSRDSGSAQNVMALQKELAATAEALRKTQEEKASLQQRLNERSPALEQQEIQLKELELRMRSLTSENQMLRAGAEESESLNAQKLLDMESETVRLKQGNANIYAQLQASERALKTAQARLEELEKSLSKAMGEKAQLGSMLDSGSATVERERRELRAEHDRKLAAAERDANQRLHDLELQLRRIDAERQSALSRAERLQAELDSRLGLARSEKDALSAALQKQLDQLQREKDELLHDNERRLQGLMNDRANLQRDFEAKIAALTREKNALQAELEKRIDMMRGEKDAAALSLQKQFEAALREKGDLQQELERKLSVLTGEKQAVQREMDAKIALMTREKGALQAEMENRLAKAGKDRETSLSGFEAKIAALSAHNEELRHSLTLRERELDSEKAKMFGEFNARAAASTRDAASKRTELERQVEELESVRSQLEATAGSLRSTLDLRTKQFDSERSALRAELEKRAAELDRLGSEIARLESEMTGQRTQYETRNAKQTQEQAALQSELVRRVKVLTAEKDEILRNNEGQLAAVQENGDRFRAEAEKKLAQLVNERQALKVELERVAAQKGSESLSVVKNLQEQLATIAKERDTLQKTLDAKLAEFQRDIAQVKSEHSRKITALSTEHQNLIASLEHRIELLMSENQALRAELDKKVAQFGVEKQGIRAEFQKKLSDIGSENISQIVSLQEKLAELSSENDGLRAELERRAAQHTIEKQTLKTQLDRKGSDKDLKPGSESLQARINELTAELVTLRAEYEKKLALMNSEKQLLRTQLQSSKELKNAENLNTIIDLEAKVDELTAENKSLIAEGERRVVALTAQNADLRARLQAKTAPDGLAELGRLEEHVSALSLENKTLRNELETQISQLKAEKQLLRTQLQARAASPDTESTELVKRLRSRLDELSRENDGLRRLQDRAVEASHHSAGDAEYVKLIDGLKEKIASLAAEKQLMRDEFEKRMGELNKEVSMLHRDTRKDAEAAGTNYITELQAKLARLDAEKESMRRDFERRLAELAQQNNALRSESDRKDPATRTENIFSTVRGPTEKKETPAREFDNLSADLIAAQARARELEAQLRKQNDPTLNQHINEMREQLAGEIRRLAQLLAQRSVSNEGSSANPAMVYSPAPKASLEELLAEKERLIDALRSILRGAGVPEKTIEDFFTELLKNRNLKRALALLPRLVIQGDGVLGNEDLVSPARRRREKKETLSEIRKRRDREDFISVDDKLGRHDRGSKDLHDSDADAKLIEQMNLNTQLAQKNTKLLEEKQKMQDQLNNLRNQLKNLKTPKEEYNKSFRSEHSKTSHRESGALASAPKPEDLQKLREENVTITTKFETFRDDLRLKKKILLNELANFVNSKNNFENSCYSELTRHSLHQ